MRRAASRSNSSDVERQQSSSVPLVRNGRRRRRKISSLRRLSPRYLVVAILLSFSCFVLLILGISHVFYRIRVVGDALTDSKAVKGSVPLQAFPPPYPKMTRDPNIQLSPEALDMCTKTLWRTVETTTIVLPHAETFIHTGDIDDLWLRDSASQVQPLLIPVFNNGTTASLVQTDPRLDRIVSGLIKRTAMYIRHDPYANAFRIDDSYKFSPAQKLLGRHDLISTFNYELDSACFYIRMLYFYWRNSLNGKPQDLVLRLPQVEQAVEIMVDVWIAEQRHEDDAFPTGPLFDCVNCNKPYRYVELPRDGKGTPTNASSGLTWSGFRPSDDMNMYGYNVPGNMFCIAVLGYVQELAANVWQNDKLEKKAARLAADIQRGLDEHAIVDHPEFGKIYVYEVDGLGNYLLMDDANVPSLMSIPYLGYKDYDPNIYANTRRFILSPSNPTYHSGTNALTGPVQGYGSPHMNARIANNIWPMALAVQGLTSDSVDEKIKLVETLVKASAGTGWMHESFDVSNPQKFSRSWFCWADALFAELVMSLTDRCPVSTHNYEVLEWRDPDVVFGGPFSADAQSP